MINASSLGELQHIFVPVRRRVVVDSMGGPEFLCNFQLGVRRGCCYDSSTGRDSKLQTKAELNQKNDAQDMEETYTETPPVPRTRTVSPALTGLGPMSALYAVRAAQGSVDASS